MGNENVWNIKETAGKYDELVGQLDIYESGMSKLLGLLDIQKDDICLDIGTGTGNYAIAMSAAGKKVYAVDISEEMLYIAEQKAGGISNIDFVKGSFLDLNISQECGVNKIITNLAFHHLLEEEKSRALRIIYNFLPAGGMLLLSDIMYFFQEEEYEKYLNTLKFILLECKGGNEFLEDFIRTLEQEYPTYYSKLIEMFVSAGFKIKYSEQDTEFLFSGLIIGIKE